MAPVSPPLWSNINCDIKRRIVRDRDAYYWFNVLLLSMRRSLRCQISAIRQTLRPMPTLFLRRNTSHHYRAHIVSSAPD